MRNILTFLVLLFPFFFLLNKEQRNTEYLLFIFNVNRKKKSLPSGWYAFISSSIALDYSEFLPGKKTQGKAR